VGSYPAAQRQEKPFQQRLSRSDLETCNRVEATTRNRD
jgi:hypothetical protein